MDIYSKEQRSKLMSCVRTQNTKPEVLVRKALHGMGFRFRLHNKSMPGRPDIVLSRYRTVVFVNGCFWHGHDCSKGTTLPKTNALFWKEKLKANVERDKKKTRELEEQGWRVVVVWECQTKSSEYLRTIISKAL